MADFRITTTTNLLDLERELATVTSDPSVPFHIYLARNRKHQFFKDPALVQFFATISRRRQFTLIDWHNEWKKDEIAENYEENLGGLAGILFAQTVINTANVRLPTSPEDTQKAIIGRHGLLKSYGAGRSNVRELAFLAFDPENREPSALAGLLYDSEGFIRTFQKWRERLFDVNPDLGQQDLFGNPSAPRPVMEFLHELYQNGAEHGNRSEDHKLIPGVRSVSMRRHSSGSSKELTGFVEGFQELEKYVQDWSRLNRGTSFIEVSVNDVGMGIIDRFLATRPEFVTSAEDRDARLRLLLRILLTPRSKNGASAYEQAYSSKDVRGQERGAGRGLERALEAVRKLNGFVSLRTAEFWLYRSFPNSEEIGTMPMHEVKGGPYSHVVGTRFTALFPINLQA